MPARLRPAVVAIYRFARAADDLADEGDAAPDARVSALDAFDAELDRIAHGDVPAAPPFPALAAAIREHGLPLAPFHDLGATAVTGETAAPTREPGGTDFTSFTWIGLPGFGFLQDPIEYDTRTHHSNMDFYDRVQPGDLMQAAAIEAWFVYNTAIRKDMMPRIPMPKAEK